MQGLKSKSIKEDSPLLRRVDYSPAEPSSDGTSIPVASAYPEPRQPSRPMSVFNWKIYLVLGDCFLIGLAPVLVHMAKGPDGKYPFHPVSLNLMIEIAKTCFASAMLLTYGAGKPGPLLFTSIRTFLRDAHSNRLLAVPALLYAINNYLKFAMQLYFKPTTAKMLSNLKILVIAVMMRGILKRSFTILQWEALFLLIAGITVNQLSSCMGHGGEVVTAVAWLYTAGSVTIPSMGSVYNEFALKRHMDTSLHLQNFFLYFYGMCFNLLFVTAMMLVSGSSFLSMFHGYSLVPLVLVANNALQGILSSFFFKYADTILKKYSSTIATLLTGLLSAALFGHALTLNFLLGLSIVFISMHQFFTQGDAASSKSAKGGKPSQVEARPLMFTPSPSMDHLSMSGIGGGPFGVDLSDGEGSGLASRRPLLPR
eukprot:jgi/Botrbrau1/17501/Bobra.0054s0078.2